MQALDECFVTQCGCAAAGLPSPKQHKSQHKSQQRKTQQQQRRRRGQQGPADNGEAEPSGWDGQQLSSSQPQRPGDSNASGVQQQEGQQARLPGHSQRQQGKGGRKRKAAPRGGDSDDSDDDFQQRPPPRASQPLSQPVRAARSTHAVRQQLGSRALPQLCFGTAAVSANEQVH